MKYLSVCSGIEAATVAWHPLGWEPVAFSEIEAFPSAVLSHRYPDVPNLGDMTKFESWPEGVLASVDVVVGGPPCQAFSVAGLRRSLDDDRGNVTLAYVRMIEHIDAIRRANGRPPVVAVYENVPGLLSTRDNAFGCFVGALCGCDEAPETEKGKWPKAGLLCGEARRVGYRILDAQYLGVAQRRRRIFLIAVPCELVERSGGRACPSEILALPESVSGNPPPSRKAWEGVARATAGSLTGSGRWVERPGESRGQDDVVIQCPPADSTLTTRMHKGFDGTMDSQTPIVFHTTQDLSSCADKGDQDTVITTPIDMRQASRGEKVTNNRSQGSGGPPGHGVGDAGDPAFTVSERGQAVVFTKAKRAQSNTDDESWVSGQVAPTQNQFDIGDTRATTVVAYDITGVPATVGARSTEVHASLRARPPGTSENSTTTVVATQSVRRLTPRECERLQGFPDDYTAITYRNKPACDGPRYKALGNSMAVPCMWWIGKRIAQATEGHYV